MSYKAKAPGSLMLLGEYAVLDGHPAIVAAINQFIEVTITPRSDSQIYIQSALGQYHTSLTALHVQAPFEYVLTALAQDLPSGCDIVISGNCESGIGLGSSAAVTVATLQAINTWLKKTITAADLWHQALSVIHRVQGNGSGADIAASIYGGVIYFKNNPFQVEKITTDLPICCVYSGNKLKTAHAIEQLQIRRQQQPDFFAAIEKNIAQLTIDAVPFIKNKNWPALGMIFNQAQQAMISLGVSNDLLNTLIDKLGEQSSIFGAKISGSGLGDCVIGLGTFSNNIFPIDAWQQQMGVRQIPVAISATGVGHG